MCEDLEGRRSSGTTAKDLRETPGRVLKTNRDIAPSTLTKVLLMLNALLLLANKIVSGEVQIILNNNKLP
jgi:hypothetical protein